MRNLSKPKEALAIAQKAEILGFNTPDIYTLLGDLYQQNNNFVAADNYLAKSLELSPYSGDAFYYKAISTARQGDTSSALLFLDQSLSFKPRNLQTYQAFSNFHAGLKEYDLALSYNAKGLSLFKNNIDLLVGRGLLMQRIGRADSAIIYYSRVNKIQPDYFQSYLYVGGIYFRWKSYTKAIEYYDLVKKYKPDYKQIDYLLGLSYEKMGSLAKAEEYFIVATQNNPTDLAAKYALERVTNRINFAVGYVPNPSKVQRVDCVYVEPQKLLDTNRIRINIIQSKSKVNIKTDSVRRIKIN
jgi:tetratricopeptide (TPR) repeat protein